MTKVYIGLPERRQHEVEIDGHRADIVDLPNGKSYAVPCPETVHRIGRANKEGYAQVYPVSNPRTITQVLEALEESVARRG
jgi:hypothetical protein